MAQSSLVLTRRQSGAAGTHARPGVISKGGISLQPSLLEKSNPFPQKGRRWAEAGEKGRPTAPAGAGALDMG